MCDLTWLKELGQCHYGYKSSNREISLDYPGEPKKSHELLRSKELSPAGVRVLQQRKRQERRGYGFTQ